MAVQKYNPKKITGSFKGKVGNRQFAVKFQGWMDGIMAMAEYDEDATTKHIGSQGEASVVLNCNKGAKLVVTFSQGSETNDLLSDLIPDADKNFLPIGVVTLDDLNGSTKFKAAEAWILKAAKVEFGDKITGREWTFDTGEADIHVGGAGDF